MATARSSAPLETKTLPAEKVTSTQAHGGSGASLCQVAGPLTWLQTFSRK